MMEQWFLDLDGVRSGPYQTPEVMSLVAEGEVLPHHRISTALKGEEWLTILDWRLDQAKIYQRAPYASSYEVSSMTVPTQEKKAAPVAPPAEVAPPPILEAREEPKPEVAPVAVKAEFFPPGPPPGPPPAPPKPSENLLKLSQMIENAPKEPEDPATPNKKRDPTAEMFEMLQNSKQKREAKSLKSALHDAAQFNANLPGEQSSGALGKTLLIGGGIVVLGFLLGQVFQQATPPKETVKETKAASTPFPSATPEQKQVVVDRSTDKITIRGTVEKTEKPVLKVEKPEKAEHVERARPEIHQTAPQPIAGSPEKRLNDRELEELRDLKKELQELKNMKDDRNGESDAEPNSPENAESINSEETQPAPKNGTNPSSLTQPVEN